MRALLFLIASLFAYSVWAQDPNVYLNNFDAKVYSLKTKGVQDFVVDIESSKLTRQLNDQMIFGKVENVIFRTYWTANPERLAIEIIGLPEGFKEIKEELKLSVMSILDALIPPTTLQRFAGYKFQVGASAKQFTATDTTGIAAVQNYIFKFDDQDRLVSVIGKKVVGELEITPKFEKESFADGKWVLRSLKTANTEQGQTFTVIKDLAYGNHQGMGVLSRLKVTTEQTSTSKGSKQLILEESYEFKNYKINAGESLKYFLGEGPKTSK